MVSNLWVSNGEIIVTNEWQFFPSESLSLSTFRITCTILNKDDWDRWKFRSNAYIRFLLDPTRDKAFTRNYYIKVDTEPIIYEFPLPEKYRNEGRIFRSAQVKRASKYLPYTPDTNFAQFSIKLEE